MKWKDPTWTYVPAASTDIRQTFARARRELQQRMDYPTERESTEKPHPKAHETDARTE